MHVLMISLDTGLLGDTPHGNTVERHLEYARRTGKLTIVVYNPASQPMPVRRHDDSLVVHPTNTRPVLFPWTAYRVAARVQHNDPADVVTTQDPFATGLVGLLLKWRFGTALDVQNHSSFFNNRAWLAERPMRNRFLHILGKFVVRRADTHRVLTTGEKRHYLAMGIAEECITVLNTPTDVARFAADCPPSELAALRDQLNIAPQAPVILWVGLPAAVKNVELLLEAYRLVRVERPDARLVLVGDFTERPDFVTRSKALEVIFPGRVNHQDLAPYYQMAQVYTHSSRYEGFGKVLVEALAAGTPVVATRTDGTTAIISHGKTGYLCEHIPDALAHAIGDLLHDPEKARSMGRSGRADVLARFNYTRQLDEVAASFRHTLEVKTAKK